MPAGKEGKNPKNHPNPLNEPLPHDLGPNARAGVLSFILPFEDTLPFHTRTGTTAPLRRSGRYTALHIPA